MIESICRASDSTCVEGKSVIARRFAPWLPTECNFEHVVTADTLGIGWDGCDDVRVWY